jgi:protein involved in polysaccharide export with SLBB domain
LAFLVSTGLPLFTVVACAKPGALVPVAELPHPVEGPYRGQVADALEVRLFLTPDHSQTAIVGADGAITLGLVGNVNAASHRLDELTEVVRELCTDADLLEPQIMISVYEFSEMKVYVRNRVHAPIDYGPGQSVHRAVHKKQSADPRVSLFRRHSQMIGTSETTGRIS